MDLISDVTLLGGVCDRATIVRLRSESEVDAALRAGTLVRDARGRYALGTTAPAIRTANSVAGVLSHRSAAQYWGWAQKAPPALPEVTFARERRLEPTHRRILVPHWSELVPGDVAGPTTSQTRTLVDCMRNLPLDESLPIVESAIRADDVTAPEVTALAASTRGRGRARIQAVAQLATGKTANPLEAVLLAQASLVPGLSVVPQLPITIGTRVRHPDLVDPHLKIVLEAEGYAWHGDSAAFTRDSRRYDEFVLDGWLVLRFSWSMVMYDAAYVQRTLVAAVARASSRHANVARETPERSTDPTSDIRMFGEPVALSENRAPGRGQGRRKARRRMP